MVVGYQTPKPGPLRTAHFSPSPSARDEVCPRSPLRGIAAAVGYAEPEEVPEREERDVVQIMQRRLLSLRWANRAVAQLWHCDRGLNDLRGALLGVPFSDFRLLASGAPLVEEPMRLEWPVRPPGSPCPERPGWVGRPLALRNSGGVLQPVRSAPSVGRLMAMGPFPGRAPLPQQDPPPPVLAPVDVTGALLAGVAERLRGWRRPVGWRTAAFTFEEPPLAPRIGAPRGVLTVSLEVPRPSELPLEEWTPLGQAAWEQLKALFGPDAPRRSGDSPKGETVLSSEPSSGVTQSSLSFPCSETVPSSGSSVVMLGEDPRPFEEFRYPALCSTQGGASFGLRTQPCANDPGVGSRAGCDSTGLRLVEAGVEPNPGPREDFQLRPELLRWLVSTTGWPQPLVDGFAASHNALCSVFWDNTTDAFTQPWLRESPVWINPPFHLLGVVVRHIRKYGAHALVLCPHCSPSLTALRALSRDEVVLPRIPLFLRQGWDPMPTPPWGTSVFYVHHWPVGLRTLLGPTGDVSRPTHTPLLQCGDVESNPGPSSGPSAVLLSHQEWLLGEFVNDPGRAQWDVRWLMGQAGPDGGEPGSPRGLLFTCCICDESIYARTLLPLWGHRCPPGSFEAEEAEVEEPPRTGRGDALLSHGDVESNPGPSPSRKDKGVVRPREGVQEDVDMAPSAADPTFVPRCPGGPGDAILPSYEGGAMSAPAPRRPSLPGDGQEDWDGDLAHQPSVSSNAAFPKRGRSTGPGAAGNLWMEGPPPAHPPRSLSAPPLAPVTPPVSLQRLLQCPVGVLSHIPAALRATVGDALALLLRGVAEAPTELGMWALLAFPKLVLRANARGGRSHNTDVATEVNRRLFMWRTWQWGPLWEEALASARPQGQGPITRGRTAAAAVTEETCKRLRRLVGEGAPARAMQTLLSEGVHDAADPEVQQRLRELHPGAPPLASEDEGLLGTASPLVPNVSEAWLAAVLDAVRTFPNGSAPGPSGLRPSALQDLLCRNRRSGDLLPALATFVQACVNGRLPDTLGPMLCAARLIPLKKKDGGVRPVAVGEVLRRVVGKCLLRHPNVADQVKSLQPLQLGVGVPMACPIIAHGLRRAVNELPVTGDWAILQVDVSNAFNTVARSAIMAGARDFVPAVIPWMQFCYSKTVPLFTGDQVIHSSTGTHQGCPMGPLGFALGIQRALRTTAARTPLSWMSFYLDDGHLLAPLADLAAAFPVLQTELAAVGLRVNLAKCALWGPGERLVAQLPEDHPLRGVTSTPFLPDSGLQVLGLPVDFPGTLGKTRCVFDDAASKLSGGLSALAAAQDAQVQHALLRSCADACKLLFLAQGCEVGAPMVKQAMERADDDIMSTFEEVLGMPLSLPQRLQASLPMRKGGCGIKLLSTSAAPARLAFLATYAAKAAALGVPAHWCVPLECDVVSACEALAATGVTRTLAPLAGWRERPATICSAQSLHRQQRWWAEHVVEAQAERLRVLVQGTARDAARLALQCKGQGTGWMHVAPHPGLDTVMGHAEYQLGLRWWLGLPLVPDMADGEVCPKCHATALDRFGDHLMCCRQNNFSARHGALQDSLLLVLGIAKQPAEREQPLRQANASRVLRQQLRPADILLRGWAGGRDVAVDVTIAHPLQLAELPWQVDKAKSFLRRREELKIGKYEAACQLEGWGFLPMAFSTWATPGPGAFGLLARILRRAAAGADADDRSTRLAELRDTVTQSVMRQVVRLLEPALSL